MAYNGTNLFLGWVAHLIYLSNYLIDLLNYHQEKKHENMSKLFKGTITCAYLSLFCFNFSIDMMLQPYQNLWTKWSLPEKKKLLLIFHTVKAEETNSRYKLRISFNAQKLLKSL